MTTTLRLIDRHEWHRLLASTCKTKVQDQGKYGWSWAYSSASLYYIFLGDKAKEFVPRSKLDLIVERLQDVPQDSVRRFGEALRADYPRTG